MGVAALSTAVTCTPWALNAWATRVVPVNRSSAVRAPEASQISPGRDEAALGAEVLDHAERSRRVHGAVTGPTLRWGAMAPGDLESSPAAGGSGEPSHWVSWHGGYEDPASNLSRRLRAVRRCCARRSTPFPAPTWPDPVVSLCAGQGRDVIDVVAAHPPAWRCRRCWWSWIRRSPPSPGPGRKPGVASHADRRGRRLIGPLVPREVPADVVLVCGVFGNVRRGRHRRPTGRFLVLRPGAPRDLDGAPTAHATRGIRDDYSRPPGSASCNRGSEGTVMAVGHHLGLVSTVDGAPTAFRPRAAAVRLRGGRAHAGMTGPGDDTGADLDDLLNPLPDPERRRPRGSAAACAGATTGRHTAHPGGHRPDQASPPSDRTAG